MLLYFSIGFFCFLTSCLSQEINADVDSFYPESSPPLESFDWQLVKELSPNNQNLLISPISLKLVLALLYEGSAGDTEREFQNVFQFDNKESVRAKYNKTLKSLQAINSNEYELDIATRIFLDSQREPQKKFSAIAKSFFDTTIQATNFDDTKNASDTVNSWVEEATHGKITEIVKPDDLTRSIMVIANALYFRGSWKYPFQRNETFRGNFFLNPKETVNVQYMTTVGEFYIHERSRLDAKFLRLPYKGHQYSLWIVLPNSKGGLPDLIKNINSGDIYESLYAVEKRTVHVTLPKFKFAFQENYVEFLKKFGLRQMFQNTASFPGIVRGDSNVLRILEVSDIIQKTGIELDEEGTVIYSATGINIGNKFGEAQISFNASHPFMFFLYEESASTILFIGKVGNPLVTDDRFYQEENKISGEASSAQHNVNIIPTPSFVQPPNNLSPAGGFNGLVNNQNTFLQPEVTSPEIQYQQTPINFGEERFSGFDFQLLREFSKLNENVLISPLSIKTTLAMVLEGANGQCAREILMALRIGENQQSTVRNYLRDLLRVLKQNSYMEIANSVFVSKKVRVIDSYRNVLDYYKGHIQPVDFSHVQEAVNDINSWVSSVTRGAIPSIVAPENIYKDSVVIIANALYFKGKWRTAFDEKNTRIDYFHTARGDQNVQMMQVTNYFNYSYLTGLRAEAVDLPYEDDYSMLIVMPSDMTNIENLAADMHGIAHILDNMNSTELNLSMPKFDVDYARDLIDVLKPMGVKTIFTPEANLTGIVANDNVQVNRIIHKTKIQVDEQGTKAAAATGVFVIPLIGSTARKVTINKPFIYFIYHKQTRSIIFEGIFRYPQVSYQQRQPVPVQSRNSYTGY